MAKRILIFSLNYHPFIGGAEVAIKEITDRCNPSGYEFHVVALRFDSRLPRVERMGNVTVHRIGFTLRAPSPAALKRFPLHFNKHLYQFLAFFKAWQLHRKTPFEVVWAMMAHSTGVPAALFKMRFPRVRYVLTLQEGDPPAHIERLMRPLWPLFSRAFTSANTVTAISTFLADWARRRGAREIRVVPNAVETARFAAPFTLEERAARARALGARAGDVLLVTTSRLVHKNAVDTVIRAIPRMPPQVVFLVCGTGPDDTKLRLLAEDLGVASRVRFLGEVSQEALPLTLAACDIFVRASRSEGMGISFIEAMAAGLPVIATHEGGIPDFLFDEKRNPGTLATGWAVDADAPEQVAAAVADILARPERAERITETAKAMVIEKYDWDRVAREMREYAFDHD